LASSTQGKPGRGRGCHRVIVSHVSHRSRDPVLPRLRPHRGQLGGRWGLPPVPCSRGVDGTGVSFGWASSEEDLEELLANQLVERVLAVLQADNAFFDGGMSSALQLPWELTPARFLDFADADLTEPSDDRALVNALSNANRALHCQVDSILFSLGLYDTTRSKRFPSKLELLSRLGIVTRNALERLNESRNLTEHEYAIPVETEVRLFSDVVALFIEATNRYIREFTWDFSTDDDALTTRVSIRIEAAEGKVYLLLPGDKGNAQLPASDPMYVEMLGLAVPLAIK
jgi:hypothetical protein